ncbi:MAG: hypothetical protein EOO61_18055 [Hymenobacter sp.]|nr:MAG: hypothetical protein EOO61_18055 [Hymenobacter sp.]
MKVKIHCFEGEWDRKNSALSVRPLLDILKHTASEKQLTYTHKFCQSIERLREDLCLDRCALAAQTYQHCFYLAFHGDADGLWAGDSLPLSLTEVAGSLGSRATNSIIFIGSCGTRTTKAQLLKLRNETQAALVVGYASDVDWLTSSLFETLFFSILCQYKQFASFLGKVKSVSEEETFAKLKVQFIQ